MNSADTTQIPNSGAEAESDSYLLATVIICTHNPRAGCLDQTLDGLRAQTLPTSEWELLVIDNASAEQLATTLDLTWHPRGRVIREDAIGLTPARLRGIRESSAPLLVFVDDDNVLAVDYLAQAEQLFRERHDVGAASGSIEADYQALPPAWLRDSRASWICVRPLTASAWSNFNDDRSMPCGAGLIIRRTVAQAYAAHVRSNELQALLDRRGSSLISGGDVAIAKTALRLGYSVGQFEQLRMRHIIPAERLKPAYLFRLYRSIVASGFLLDYTGSERLMTLRWRRLPLELLAAARKDWVELRLVWERIRAHRLAHSIVRRLRTP